MKRVYPIDNKKRSWLKSILWRVIGIFLLGGLGWWLTGNWQQTTLIVITFHGIRMVLYYYYERVWEHIDWGWSLAKVNPGGVTIWFTGLPSSGKSTIAEALAARLKGDGYKVERLDGDIIRQHLWRELGFTKEDRDENIRRAAFLAGLFTRNSIMTITTFISPYRELRRQARESIGAFVEVYVKCPVEVCMQRDPKGLYRKALAGEISNFTGVSDPYEEPLNPEVLIESDKETVEESVTKVMDKLKELRCI